MQNLEKTLLLLGLLIYPAACLFSQRIVVDESRQIKFSPVRLVDIANPTLEISYEKFHGSRYSSQMSAGFMNDFFNTTPFEKYKGVRLSFEEKLFYTETLQGQSYYSVEVAFLKVKYTSKDSFSRVATDYLDTFRINKTHYSINFKRGQQVQFGRIVVDMSIGLGLKYKVVKQRDFNSADAIKISLQHPKIYRITDTPGSYFTLNMPLSIRIGFMF